MPMKPKGRSPLAPTKSIRPKDATEGRAGAANQRAMRPGGAADREGTGTKSGAVSKSPRPKKNPYR